jgi:hypothetical protein
VYNVSYNAAQIMKDMNVSAFPSWMRSVLSNMNIGALTSSIYVDSSGQLRRLGMDMSLSSPTAFDMHETFDFSHFGAQVSVAAPNPSQAVDFIKFLNDAKAANGAGG